MHESEKVKKVKVKSLSRVRLLVTPWTAAHQAPPSMGFTRQEYWGGVPLPSPHRVLILGSKRDESYVTLDKLPNNSESVFSSIK